MHRRLLLIAAALVVVSAVGFLWVKDRYEHINPKQVYSESERTDLIRRADTGDVKASRRLYLYYSFVRYSPEQREKWLLVGANAGDARSIYSLAFMYSAPQWGKIDLEKASYWANVLQKDDPEGAKEIRREIERVRKQQKACNPHKPACWSTP